jgi:iron complex transport system ATP-binding protein
VTVTLAVDDVTFRRDGRLLLDAVSFSVRAGEHWALLGPNGAGKSTLLSLCGARQHPTTGTVHVLGHRLGRVDMRDLRTHLGHVDPRTHIEPRVTASDAVLTGLTASSSLLRTHPAGDDDRRLAAELLRTLGMADRADTAWEHLSQGERGRVLIARALVTQPSLLLLDEPSTGLDLAAREILLSAIARLGAALPGLSSVYVTHHLEELPVSTTHAALLREGRLTAAGPVDEVLTSGRLSDAFGLPIDVRRDSGRWTARAAGTHPL